MESQAIFMLFSLKYSYSYQPFFNKCNVKGYISILLIFLSTYLLNTSNNIKIILHFHQDIILTPLELSHQVIY